MTTIRFRAPFQVRIYIDINVFLEFQIFSINLLGPKLSNLIFSEFEVARIFSTFNLPNLAISNIELQIVNNAIIAKSMFTLQSICIFNFIVHIANLTFYSTKISCWLNSFSLLLRINWLIFSSIYITVKLIKKLPSLANDRISNITPLLLIRRIIFYLIHFHFFVLFQYLWLMLISVFITDYTLL